MRPKIYLLGDSITEYSFQDGGWGVSLANLFSRKADLLVRGYAAYNTRWALKVLEKGKVFPAPGNGDGAALAVTVFFGANDACLPESWSAHLHVPLKEYKQNLRSIVSFIKTMWPNVVVVLITPPPIDEAARLLENCYNEGLVERSNQTTGKYAKACLEVATECGISSVDLWSKMQQLPGWEKAFLCDGLHLTPAGNKIVFEEVVKKLKESGISAETLPFDLPHWSELAPPNDALKVFDNFLSS